jgi:capsule polysaccharide export protein KpsE/RkpR
MNNEFSFSGLVKVIGRNRKLLIILTIVSVILGTIFSGPQFIRPKYKSTAIVYPVNIFPYSVESETEQMMQVFNASDIRDYIIDKFDLYNHWDIDEDNSKARYYMLKTYDENVNITRTNFESANVSVMDFSPDTAKLIVDDILIQFNLKAREFAQNTSREYLVMAEKTMAFQSAKIDSLAIKLDSLRIANNILDYELQTQEVTQGYYRMLASGKGGNQINEAKMLLENLKLYGGEFNELTILLEYYIEDYSEWSILRNEYYNDANKQLSYLNIVEAPEVPVKKSYPVRWVILLSIVMGTLLFAIIILALFQKDNF